MTEDERALLIKTAQALGSLSHILATGADPRELEAFGRQVDQVLRPLVLKLTG